MHFPKDLWRSVYWSTEMNFQLWIAFDNVANQCKVIDQFSRHGICCVGFFVFVFFTRVHKMFLIDLPSEHASWLVPFLFGTKVLDMVSLEGRKVVWIFCKRGVDSAASFRRALNKDICTLRVWCLEGIAFWIAILVLGSFLWMAEAELISFDAAVYPSVASRSTWPVLIQ